MNDKITSLNWLITVFVLLVDVFGIVVALKSGVLLVFVVVPVIAS